MPPLTKIEELKWMLQDAGYHFFVLREDPKFGLELIVAEDIRSAGRPAHWPICQDLSIDRKQGRSAFSHQIQYFANYAEHLGVYKLKSKANDFFKNGEYIVKVDEDTNTCVFPVKRNTEGGYAIVGGLEQVVALTDAGFEWFRAYNVETGNELAKRLKLKRPPPTK